MMLQTGDFVESILKTQSEHIYTGIKTSLNALSSCFAMTYMSSIQYENKI